MKKKHGITLKELIRLRDLAIEQRNNEEDKDYREDCNGRIDRINKAIQNNEFDKEGK